MQKIQDTSRYVYHLATAADMARLGHEWRVCPGCGRKEFKPYVDATGEPLDRTCGRCNRERNCCYHLPPHEFRKENPGHEANRPVANVAGDRPAKRAITMPSAWVAAKTKDNGRNVLLQFLRSLPWDGEQRQRLEAALAAYGVGTDKLGRTIWWQIDEQGHVRSGKQIAYKADGHRDKNRPPGWIHSAVRGVFPADEYEYVGCLFGLHLVARHPGATVCLVESEKSAVVCSAFFPMEERVWVASGGLTHVNAATLAPLLRARRKITAYPDHDGFQDWTQRLADIDRSITVSSFVEQLYEPARDPVTADIADILLRVMADEKQDAAQRFEKLKNDFVNFKDLTECVQMEVVQASKNTK